MRSTVGTCHFLTSKSMLPTSNVSLCVPRGSEATWPRLKLLWSAMSEPVSPHSPLLTAPPCVTVMCWVPTHVSPGAKMTGPEAAMAGSTHTISLYSSSPKSAMPLAFATQGFHTTASGNPLLRISKVRFPALSMTWGQKGATGACASKCLCAEEALFQWGGLQ